MERTHRELGPWFTNRLSGDDPDRIADLHHRPGAHVPAIALLANPVPRLARHRRADLELAEIGYRSQSLAGLVVDHLIAIDDDLTGVGIHERDRHHAPHDLVESDVSPSRLG